MLSTESTMAQTSLQASGSDKYLRPRDEPSFARSLSKCWASQEKGNRTDPASAGSSILPYEYPLEYVRLRTPKPDRIKMGQQMQALHRPARELWH